MSFCTKCGGELEEGAKFCSKCGVEVGNESNLCPECGKELEENASFCPECGAKIGDVPGDTPSKAGAPVPETESNDPDYWYDKGCKLIEVDLNEEAIVCLDKYIELDPNNEKGIVGALDNKAVALTGLGRKEEAIQCFDKALEIDPNNQIVQEHKSMVVAVMSGKPTKEEEEVLDVFRRVTGLFGKKPKPNQSGKYEDIWLRVKRNGSDMTPDDFMFGLKMLVEKGFLRADDEKRIAYVTDKGYEYIS